jgi:hypothetical protein
VLEYKLKASQSNLNLEDFVTQYSFSIAKNRNTLQTENFLERQEAIFNVAQLLSWQQPTTETDEFFDELCSSTWGNTMNQIIHSDFIELAGKKLRPVDLAVLQFRNGLHPLAPGNTLTLEETGQRLNITRERVRQIELRAKVRFKSAIEELLAQTEIEITKIDREATMCSPNFRFIKTNVIRFTSDVSPCQISDRPITSHFSEPDISFSPTTSGDWVSFVDFEAKFLLTCDKENARTDYKNLYYFLFELRQHALEGRKQQIPVSKLLKKSNVKGRGYLKVKEIDTILSALNVKSFPHFNSVGIDDFIELIFD